MFLKCAGRKPGLVCTTGVFLNGEQIESEDQADSHKPDELGTPDMVLLQSEEVAVFDNLAGRINLVINVDPIKPDTWNSAQRRLDELTDRLRGGGPSYGEANYHEPILEKDFQLGFEREDFIEAVKSAKSTSCLEMFFRWFCHNA
jgi:anthranilate/para-aminobenzoate synthase component I